MREGFEPSKFNPVTDSEFAVGDDDDEPQNVGKMHEDSEEARQWDDGHNVSEEPQSSTTNTKYGSLDDRDVWNKDREQS